MSSDAPDHLLLAQDPTDILTLYRGFPHRLALLPALPELTHLTTVADAIGTASAHGLLSSTAMLAGLAQIAGADHDIEAAVAAARTERDRPRTIRFARANQIVELWWGRTGLIGQVLDIARGRRRVAAPSRPLRRG